MKKLYYLAAAKGATEGFPYTEPDKASEEAKKVDGVVHICGFEGDKCVLQLVVNRHQKSRE